MDIISSMVWELSAFAFFAVISFVFLGPRKAKASSPVKNQALQQGKGTRGAEARNAGRKNASKWNADLGNVSTDVGDHSAQDFTTDTDGDWQAGAYPRRAHGARPGPQPQWGNQQHWNPQAPVFSPGNTAQEQVPSDAVLALKETLAKLTPQDAATLRSLLDAKERGCEPPTQFPYSIHNQRQYNRENTPNNRMTRPERNFLSSDKSIQKSFQDNTADTLRTNLRDLAQIDSGRVLMVRKINKLGVGSAALVEEYFKKFGTVERVMVTHCTSKSTTGGPPRLRPASCGFLVMSCVEEVQAALAHNGGAHVIQGFTVTVCPFQSHPIGEEAKEAQEE